MNDESDRNPGKRLGVFAIPEKNKDGERGGFWTRIGVAFTNRDGSITILLNALPLGTSKLQVRELTEDGRPVPGAGGRARSGEREFEEVRT